MKLLRLIVVICGVAGSMSLLTGIAQAGPDKSPRSELLELDCGDFGVIEVALIGNGEFSPGHIVGSNSLGIPVAFEFEGTFTPVGGDPMPIDETSLKGAGNAGPKDGDFVECTFEESGSDEFGSFEITGTVTVFIPRGHVEE